MKVHSGSKGKALVRAKSRRGTKTHKTEPGRGDQRGVLTVCSGCGATLARRSWRRGRSLPATALDQARWARCPACEQVREGQYQGRVLLRGGYAEAHYDQIRRRIENVARRAAFTQPERRVVEMGRCDAGLEVLTTSQKLAHRIARELTKAFGGRATYRWSDADGSLFAVWHRGARALV
jgi:hypothetical protein